MQAHEHMTIDEQVAFAWTHRDHFADVRAHNLAVAAERYRGNWNNHIRNGWAELAHLATRSASSPAVQLELMIEAD